MSKNALLIFTKNPEAGKVKTRLAATLGNEEALAIYKQLLTYTASVTNDLPVDKFVCYSNYIETKDLWKNDRYYKQLQNGNDLGERMNNAFVAAFEMGYKKVAIIGTDCPCLNEEIIMNAFAYTNTHDIVIGPAEDGGYYLLGMNRLHSKLFKNIPWSTNMVLNDTLKRCEELNLKYHLLPVLNDIDEAKDMKLFSL